MLTITYDPNRQEHHRYLWEDGLVERMADDYTQIHSHTKGIEITVGNELFIQHILLNLLEGRLKGKDVLIIFNGEEIRFDEENGTFDKWPKGFCDEFENVARRILNARLDWKSNKGEK